MNNYGITENTQETTMTSSINAGIQENIKIDSVVCEPLKEDSPAVIQVNFADAYGSTLREILWEVDEDVVRERAAADNKTHARSNKELGFVKGEAVTADDAVKKAYQLFNQRAKHIATKVVDEQTIVDTLKGAGSYAEFGKLYASLFTPERLAKARVRLKVILNTKDYSKLPTFPPFIESMEVPTEKTSLEINPKYDRITKATADANASDPMAQAAGGSLGLPGESSF